MATPASAAGPVGPETLIIVKVLYNDNTRRFKIPLRDLGARVFPQKLRQLLGIPPDVNVIFERYSDSAASYVRLDSENVAVYKQLYRAAKAKLKLRIKAIVINLPRTTTSSLVVPQPRAQEVPTEQEKPTTKYSYLNTVLSSPLPVSHIGTLPGVSGSTPNLPTDANKTSTEWPNNDVVSTQPRYREPMPSPDDASLPVISHTSPTGTFCINCNNCGRSIPSEHYHCSICEDGDYDLCTQCIDAGVSCPVENHWLIKRFVKDGIVTNSTTETVAPRKLQVKEENEEKKKAWEPLPRPVPARVPEPPSLAPVSAVKMEKRICNGCLKAIDETKMVACTVCETYHLCVTCLLKDKHGHHPAHTFALVQDREFCLKSLVSSRCRPGRHHQHAAVCDGCDKRIIGVRHKCLTCPDWDYCAECVPDAPQSHPGHRFAPIYEAITEPPHHYQIHHGIFCDGPLCKDKPIAGYITGVRYKCAVCHDTDFCAKCEALPTNTHNRTHPLIKFSTPVHSVTVSTISDDGMGGHVVAMGDRVHKATSTEAAAPVEFTKENTDEKQPEELEASKTVVQATTSPVEKQVKTDELSCSTPVPRHYAMFVRDTVSDGTELPPNTVFQQTWTLHNPGPLTWPAGSDVRFVGGDSMFNVDTNQPSSLDSITSAMESNKLSVPLEPGQNADFTVTLKTPDREGTAISYWRLKLPNGLPFGDRLWCDVQVRTGTEPVEKKEDKHMVDNSFDTPEVEESEQTGSAMIFPLLDKESPVTSTHEEMATAPSAPTVSTASERDILEDVENLTLEDGDMEDGFLTDEEYDILDASDQEFLDAKQSQKK